MRQGNRGLSVATIDIIEANETASLTTSLLTEDFQFETLQPEWDELLDHSDQRVFFLRWAWNRLWWRSFKPPNSHLFIVTCRDYRGRLTGLAPLYWKQRRTAGIPNLRELFFLGSGIYAQTSEYLDVVARRGCETAVAEAVASFLRDNLEWDRLHLSDIPATSSVLPSLRRALGESSNIAGCNRSYYISTDTDWESFSRGLSTSTRKSISRRRRRLFESSVCVLRSVKNPEELEPALDAVVRLHQARWKSKGEPGAFALTGVETFIREAARLCIRERRLRLWTLEVDSQVAAAQLGFFDNGVVHAFQAGFDPAYVHKGLGSLMSGLCIQSCVEDEAVEKYDFMGGSDEYKRSWTQSAWDTVTLTMLRRGPRSSLFKAVETATRAGKAVIKNLVPKDVRLAGRKLVERHLHYKG